MTTRPSIHLSIVQPMGYVHSLGLLDPALYVKHQLERLGVNVTLAKNRLREDSVNVIFGAHLGFDRERLGRHACVFFNLEQLGPGGARLGADYLSLLRDCAVADYDPGNAQALGLQQAAFDIVPFLHAAYLHDTQVPPIADRPIDLLFFGSLNDRRRRFIERVERCGIPVSMPDRPLYGPERDQLVRQAKAVLNCHFYDAARFERIRIQHCLSLGTPVLCERNRSDVVDPAFDDCVSWLTEEGLEHFLTDVFRRPDFGALANAQLERWRQQDELGAFERWYGRMAQHWAQHLERRPDGVVRPSRLHFGDGQNYVPGWLNLHPEARQAPDAVLDLAGDLTLPLQVPQLGGGEVVLAGGSLERIRISTEPMGTARSAALLDRALVLLREGGELQWRVQGRSALDAMSAEQLAHTLAPWTSRFWESGALSHRFEIRETVLTGEPSPAHTKVGAQSSTLLVKVATTLAERTMARMHLHDFGLQSDSMSATGTVSSSSSSTPVAAEAMSRGPEHSETDVDDDPLPVDPSDRAPVRVHVAHYRPDQLGFIGKVDPELFVPWNVEFNRGSRLLEFDLFKVLLDRAPSHRRYWGVFSWKFVEKSGMQPDEVARQIRSGVKAGADVIVLNPAVASNALFRNVFEQGQVCGHAYMQTVARATGLAQFVDTLMRHDTFAMSSYVVGTRAFWKEYVDFVEAYLEGAEELVAQSVTFRSIYHGSAGYWRDASFDYRPFVVERLLQVFLHLRRLKVRYMEPDEGLFHRKFGDEADALWQMYRLKRQAPKSPNCARQWEQARQVWLDDRPRLFRIFHMDDPLSQPAVQAQAGPKPDCLALTPLALSTNSALMLQESP